MQSEILISPWPHDLDTQNVLNIVKLYLFTKKIKLSAQAV